MGPRARYLGKLVPQEELIWQDPIPPVDHALVDAQDAAALKAEVLASGLGLAQLVRTAWASASTFRASDKRGGANGARIRLSPQKDWAANQPAELDQVLAVLEGIRSRFNAQAGGGKKISLADLIVLAGGAAIEAAAQQAGLSLSVPFHPGRMDARADQTDAASFAVLEPQADGFRNFVKPGLEAFAPELLLDKAQLLSLGAPEMTVLLGGLRALGVGAEAGHPLVQRPGVLSNEFFVNLLDMGTAWQPVGPGLLEGRDRKSGVAKGQASTVDLVFGSNSQLRAIAEVYASTDAQQKFADDFAAAWAKVMELDRFDLR